MTDLLESQHTIKSRRDASGRFLRSPATIAAEIAAERMKTRLLRDVEADERSRGVVYEHGHYRALPGAGKALCVAESGPDLFEVAA